MLWNKKLLKRIEDLEKENDELREERNKNINETSALLKDYSELSEKYIAVVKENRLYKQFVGDESELSEEARLKLFTNLEIHKLTEELDKQRHEVLSLQNILNSLRLPNELEMFIRRMFT